MGIMRKRALIFAMAFCLLAGTLFGCGSNDGNETALTVGDETATADLANFYARYNQAQYETYFGAYLGEDMWNSEAEEGVTYEESVKDSVIESLENMMLCDIHKDEYDVSLTEDDEDLIEKYAKEFSDSNSLEAKDLVSGDDETVTRMMELMTVYDKMLDAIEAGADTKVSDDEAAQKRMRYVFFETTTTDEEGNTEEMSDEEKDKVKEEAQKFDDRVKKGADFKETAENMGLESETATFDSDGEDPDAAVVEVADQLKKNEVTDVIMTEDGFYVAKVTSMKDKDATKEKKEEIVEERKEELFETTVDGWREETTIEVNNSVWDKISFKDLSVAMYEDESEDYADPIETDDVAEARESGDDDEEIVIEEDSEEK